MEDRKKIPRVRRLSLIGEAPEGEKKTNASMQVNQFCASSLWSRRTQTEQPGHKSTWQSTCRASRCSVDNDQLLQHTIPGAVPGTNSHHGYKYSLVHNRQDVLVIVSIRVVSQTERTPTSYRGTGIGGCSPCWHSLRRCLWHPAPPRLLVPGGRSENYIERMCLYRKMCDTIFI